MTELRKTNFDLEIGTGNIPNYSVRNINGNIDATTTESTISPNLTGRYPWPASAATMTVVSTSAADTAAGTGLQAVLVRGLTVSAGDWIDDSETVVMNGTTGVVTTKSFIRINSLLGLSVGSGGVNAGTVTISNGASVLQSMVIGDNLTRAMIWSTATNIPAYIRSGWFAAAKSVNDVLINGYLTPTGLPILKPISVTLFEGQLVANQWVPFELAGKSDFEITAESSASTVMTDVQFELTLIDNE